MNISSRTKHKHQIKTRMDSSVTKSQSAKVVHSIGNMTSFVLNAGKDHGGLYLPSKNSPTTLYPSLSKLLRSAATFPATTASAAPPPNLNTPYFLSPSSLKVTLPSTGCGASAAT